MATIIIRPNGFVSDGAWHAEGGGTLWADIDDGVVDPNAGDGVDIYGNTTTVCKVAMSKPDIPVSIISSIKITTRAKSSLNGLSTWKVAYHYGNITSSYELTGHGNNSYSYADNTWSSLSLSTDDVKDLEIWFSLTNVGGGSIYVDVAYITITYIEQKLTNSDILSGTISQSEMGYQKALFKLKEDTSVVFDQPVEITEDYTDKDGTSNIVIFEGYVQDYSLTDIKDINVASKGDQISRISPIGIYDGPTTVRIDQMINNSSDYLTTSYTTQTLTGYYPSSYNFYSQGSLINEDISWIDSLTGYGGWDSTAEIASLDDGDGNSGSVHNNAIKIDWAGATELVRHDLGLNGVAEGCVEWWFTEEDMSLGCMYGFRAGEGTYNDPTNYAISVWIKASDDKIWISDGGSTVVLYNTALTHGKWYRCSVEWYDNETFDIYLYDNDENLLASSIGADMRDGEDPLITHMTIDNYTALGVTYFDAIGETWLEGYNKGDNIVETLYDLPVSAESDAIEYVGGNTIQSILTEGAKIEQVIWTISPLGDVRWHAGTEDSGVDITSATKVWDIKGSFQTKRYNRVVLLGAEGLEAIANDTDRQDSAGQIIIYKDYRASINNLTALQTMADNLLAIQKDPPLRISLKMEWEAKGWIQVGELISIPATTFKYNNSSSYIPAGDYRITAETYHIKEGAYHFIELNLEDVLIYREPTERVVVVV